MELKLKKREVRIDVYGEMVVMRYPSVMEHQEYIKEIIKDEADEYEETKKFFVMLGMKEEVIKTLEMPDMHEMIKLLTGQLKK